MRERFMAIAFKLLGFNKQKFDGLGNDSNLAVWNAKPSGSISYVNGPVV